MLLEIRQSPHGICETTLNPYVSEQVLER